VSSRPAREVVLRQLVPGDLTVLVRLERALFGASAWSRSMLAEELVAPARWYIGAEVVPGELAGYAGLWFDGDDTQVMTIGVARENQGAGIGSVLLGALLARSRELGARAVLLEVRVDNAPALALYERFGFEREGRRRGYYQPENIDAWIMRRELDEGNDMTTDATTTAPADPRATVLVDPVELVDLLAAGRPVVLLDVRWALGRADGRELHAAAHLPGAVYVDLDTELAGPPSPTAGRHPLPALPDLEAAARRWGVRRGVPVVAYDDGGGTSAARAWWLLRWAGVTDVRLLDGGLAAWTQAGGVLETGEVIAPEGDVVLTAGNLPTLDADEAAARAARGELLLDARAEERYRGEVEPVDPRAGHIPGAVSAPTTGNLDRAGRFLGAAALRRRFAALGATRARPGAVPEGPDAVPAPVAVYCGSGVTAAHEVAALASIGVEAALYPGSWSEWSADPARDVAVGPGPTGRAG